MLLWGKREQQWEQRAGPDSWWIPSMGRWIFIVDRARDEMFIVRTFCHLGYAWCHILRWSIVWTSGHFDGAPDLREVVPVTLQFIKSLGTLCSHFANSFFLWPNYQQWRSGGMTVQRNNGWKKQPFIIQFESMAARVLWWSFHDVLKITNSMTWTTPGMLLIWWDGGRLIDRRGSRPLQEEESLPISFILLSIVAWIEAVKQKRTADLL